ncbi:MAG TPA: RidA family protein [Xanthobacteraceae bacterium]|jgi:enamine deaminase RidA (YjgF/YER057c/UK114 family)
MSTKSLKASLAGTLLIAFVTGQAAAQEGECPKVDAEANIKALGIAYYPPPKATVGNFVPAVIVGKVMYLAGNGPKMPDGTFVIGKVGSGPGQLTVEQGYQASKLAAISLLSAIKAELGDLNKVKRIVKVLGMVNSDPAFTAQPKVINGASDLLVQVFGDCGKHARSAVGVASLIFDIAVEIEMIVELR